MTSRTAFRIAAVDDDYRVLEALGELLESAGYTVYAYPSARSLLMSGVLPSIGCLITDIGLPEIDGFDLCRRARIERPGLPVIFVTAREDPADQRRADLLGHSGLFRKPWYATALLAAVHQVVQNR